MSKPSNQCTGCGAGISGNMPYCEFCGKAVPGHKPLPPKTESRPRGNTTSVPDPKPEPEYRPQPKQSQPSNQWAGETVSQWAGDTASNMLWSGCSRLFGCLFVVGFFLVFITIAIVMSWRANNRHQRAVDRMNGRNDQKETVYDHAAKDVYEFANKNKRFPTDDEGNALVAKKFKDKNGNVLRYEQVTFDTFAFRTAGNDKTFWTNDDRGRLFDKSDVELDDKFKPHPSRQNDAATPTLDELKRLLVKPGRFNRDAAIVWMLEANDQWDNQVDFELTNLVLEHPERLMGRFIPKEERLDSKWIAAKWSSFNSEQQKELALKAEKRERGTILATMIDNWAKAEKYDAILDVVNSSAMAVQESVNFLIKKERIPREKLKARCIADLENKSRYSLAAGRLVDFDFDEKQTNEIGESIFAAFSKWKGTRGLKNADIKSILEKFGTPENSVDIARWLEANSYFDREIIAHLVDLNDEKAYTELIRLMCDYGAIPGRIHKALMKSDNHFENVLIANLKTEREYDQRRICQLLAKCGTDACLKDLEKLRQNARDEETRKVAQETIVRIARKNN